MTREELLKIAKPILFNTDMVMAILDDIKECTRRIIKEFIPNDAVWGYTIFTPEGYISCRGTYEDGYGEKFFKLPCQPENILYVRETWRWLPCFDCNRDAWEHAPCKESVFNIKYRNCGCYVYKTDIHSDMQDMFKWHPSIHMPKEAARIFLRVMDVRPERLQDITDVGAEKEGAQPNNPCDYDVQQWPNKEHFKKIWNSTIKKSDLDFYGWDANPWVWAIEFEKLEVEQ